MIYDTIIIGGGLAGTNLANKLFNSNRDNFLLFESRSYLGGRVKTIYGKKYYYEAGGARFNGNHKNLIKLLKKYEIEKYKIPSNWQNINFKYNDLTVEYQDVNDLVTDLIKLGESKPNSFLQKHTLYSLCEELMGEKYAKYLAINHPYYSEIFVTNGLDALESVKLDLREDKQFYIVQNGLSNLVQKMSQDFKNKIKLNSHLNSIEYSNNIYTCVIENLKSNKTQNFQCRKLVLAMDSLGLKKIKYLNPIKPLLNSVSCLPLLRIYQKYNTKNGLWFKDLGKIVTDSRIRYIIPVNYDEGIIMISYTDGKYSNYWKKKIDTDTVEEYIKKELDKIFPDKKIPKPIWTKSYYWNLGACYWKPNYNSKEIISKINKPFENENLYICNSNYSNRQAWMEGALESSNKVFKMM
tara:strand:- start:317 stop:1543 length:1227 start_codon:yes stop_codon:yes gene_type:complete